MIVHGIQVPQAKVASLAPLIGVQARVESLEAAHRGHLAARVASQVDIIAMIIVDTMTGCLRVISLNGMPQMVRVGRAIVTVSSGWAL